MPKETVSPAPSALAAKPHYIVLDGLRGVAALVVLVYHVFECFAASPVPHGYLAVDFFFVLSGFVIGYAYDNRWGTMGVGTFFRRRLVRLHPMVLAGAVVGAATFLVQGGVRWDGTHMPLATVAAALALSMLMLPLPASSTLDVRGNGEMFPLNGPAWSLFFEYIGNILYALLLRRLAVRWLAAIAVVTGVAVVGTAVSEGQLGVGWTMAGWGFWQGLARMLFPYTVGMLIARTFRPRRVRGTLWMSVWPSSPWVPSRRSRAKPCG